MLLLCSIQVEYLFVTLLVGGITHNACGWLNRVCILPSHSCQYAPIDTFVSRLLPLTFQLVLWPSYRLSRERLAVQIGVEVPRIVKRVLALPVLREEGWLHHGLVGASNVGPSVVMGWVWCISCMLPVLRRPLVEGGVWVGLEFYSFIEKRIRLLVQVRL